MRRDRDKPGNRSTTDEWPDSWLLPPPLPDVTEGGESSWALWEEESRKLELGFAPTQPSELAPLAVGTAAREHGARHDSLPLTADALMVVARRNNRVCPQPALWSQLYQLLGGDRFEDLQPPPVERWMWTKLSALQKRLRLREHIEWAERHGRLADVARFMDRLSEADWVHMGE